MAGDIDFAPRISIMDVILAPLLLPGLGLEGDREGASHLDRPAGGQVGRGLVVEEPEDVTFGVDGGAGELGSVDFVQFR